jgi:hypothetical protein
MDFKKLWVVWILYIPKYLFHYQSCFYC